jgi:hypothetical protein
MNTKDKALLLLPALEALIDKIEMHSGLELNGVLDLHLRMAQTKDDETFYHHAEAELLENADCTYEIEELTGGFFIEPSLKGKSSVDMTSN